jgi:hypothetical protein
MLEIKEKGLTISVEPNRKLTNVAIGISFPVKCSVYTLNKLNGCIVGDNSNYFPVGSEESVLCYNLYQSVSNALSGNPSDLLKSKVSDVKLVYYNNTFGINWNVLGNVSSVRKSLGIAFSALNPNKLASNYAKSIQSINSKSTREDFNYVADQITKSIKNNLHCMIVGKLNIDKPILQDVINVVIKKLNPNEVIGDKSKPTKHEEINNSEYSTIEVNGWHRALVTDYIKTKIPGLILLSDEKTIMLPIKEQLWDTIRKKLSTTVKDFVKAKYSKVGESLPSVFGYINISNGSLCSIDVKEAINSKMTSSSVESVLIKALK